jgi:hypothetical protein
MPGKVTDDMNSDLCKPYSDEEIKVALFQMIPTKASGSDGFPASLGILQGRNLYNSEGSKLEIPF